MFAQLSAQCLNAGLQAGNEPLVVAPAHPLAVFVWLDVVSV
jgi:hypothetical protein